MDQPNTPQRSEDVTENTPPPEQTPEQTSEEPRDNLEAGEEGEGPPLTPAGWLMTNGPYLLVFAILGVWLYQNSGWNGIWRASLVVLGISFVIFIHELGHFLAAKWCDVHVNTFSIGFGPSLPGCSFQRGETHYKVGVLPLGGYVSMVGEGLENDEEEDYPRSFKNKSVGQRMLIISAGVIMNVILGAICFVFVYMVHGVDKVSATVWDVEPGSPAWRKGIRTASSIKKIGDVEKPFFDDLRLLVALSEEGEQIPVTVETRSGEILDLAIEPRLDYDEKFPKFGITSISSATLADKLYAQVHEIPCRYDSAAAAARVIDLQPGDVVVEATAPDSDKPEGVLEKLDHDLEKRTFDVAELCKRMTALRGKPMTLLVRRAGAEAGSEPEKVTLEPKGFTFEDRMVGTTDPAKPNDVFAVKALPADPNNSDTEARDPYALYQRMYDLRGEPMVLQVKREGEEDPVNVLVPPEYYHVFGMRMKMGQVAAVREGSSASKIDLIPSSPGTTGDKLSGVKMTCDGSTLLELKNGDFDPMKLPFSMKRAAEGRPDKTKPVQVVLTVHRIDKVTRQEEAKSISLAPIEWDESWKYQRDTATSLSAPTSIPELGIAYRVETTVMHVEPNSPASKAGMQVNDRIEAYAIREAGKTRAESDWSFFQELEAERSEGKKTFDTWPAMFFVVQINDYPTVKVKVNRGELLEEPIEMTAVPDTDWPRVSRGLVFAADKRVQKASSFLEALQYGVDQTGKFIKTIYMNLRSLISGRISSKTLGGPIEIAARSFSAARDPWVLILWLGLISVNLAVVNFLPIPILDGGHMMFLIYEKLRGKPPSETVHAVATYIGLAIICSLMIYVFFLDITRRVFGW